MAARSWRYARRVSSKKQRRRQQKLRRHEYEDVYVDAEGNVVEADDADLEAEPAAAPARNGGRPAAGRRREPAARSRREIQPPSWRRVLKRGLIFAPVMFIVISLLAGDELTLEGRIVQTIFLVGIFLQFSYLRDSVMYRLWLRRTGQAAPRARRGSR